MANNAIAKTTITAMGTRNEVREMTERLKIMLPGGGKLELNEIQALAQAAIAHGLDPFNGEIYFLKDKDGTPRGLMIGIKGLRKKAHEQISANGKVANFWIDFRPVTDDDERKRLLIPAGALAYEARLFDSENLRTYTQMMAMMTESKAPWEFVIKTLGDRPYTSGYGMWIPGEPPSKMLPVQKAMKRAEADALKRRFDVPFGLSVESNSADSVEEDNPYGGAWDETTIVSDGYTAEQFVKDAIESGYFSKEEADAMLKEAEDNPVNAYELLKIEVSTRVLSKNKKTLGRDGGGID